MLDFNDLEHLCLKILSDRDGSGRIIPSKTAEAYREKYEEVMVDEYQDSNLVQEEIISLVSRSGAKVPNTFMVGDIKQSIYRFRQARPDLFKGKYDTYSDKEGSPYRKILLFKNFRSRKGIVDSVNFIFRQIMSENIGELSYDEKEALIFGADYNEAKISPSSTGDGYRLELTDSGLETELHVLNLADSREDGGEEESFDSMEDSKSLGDSEMEAADSEYSGSDENGQINIYEDEEEVPDSVQSEAILVAKRIKELMPEGSGENGFKVFDKRSGGYKGIEYRDIVILLRTTKNWAEVFVEELANYGIPAFADSGTGYFKTMEIQIMMSLLQIIDNPMQDIPFLSVLRSPVGGFNTEDLIDLRLAGRSLSFYEAMKKFSRENEGDLAQKSAEFLKNLDDWRNKALYMRTDELIWFLYGDTGYYGFAGAMPGGLQRQANLKMLFERARQYEDTSYKGLFNFISFINKMKNSSGDLGSAKVMGKRTTW